MAGPVLGDLRRKTSEVRRKPPAANGVLSPLFDAGRTHILLLVIIVLAGAYIRFSALPDSGLGTDEAEKFMAVSEFRDGRFWVDLEHPPLEKYMILLSTSLLGDDDWTIKLPNVIIGSLVPILLFLVAARMGKDPWVGQAAAAVGALSPMLIGYSLVAKEDTLVNFLTLASLLFLSVSLESREGEARPEPGRYSPLRLDGYGMTAAILAGLALSSKYTFLFAAVSFFPVIFLTRKEWLARNGRAFLLVMMATFFLCSWFLLNPYWLAVGAAHWLWEGATGHATYFLGRTYTYPPPWFYPVTFMGRVSPFITFTGFGTSAYLLSKLPWRGEGSFRERAGKHMKGDPLVWMVLAWVVFGFIIMTLLPFKGVRYVQWIILPLILLSAWGVHRAIPSGKRRGEAVMFVSIILMIPSLSHASPYFREVTYFLGSDSGMMDLDGQGFRETFSWMEEQGLEGKVSLRWEKLGSYYWDNVTGPVHDMEGARIDNVSFILIYRADTNRDLESKMTSFARSSDCTEIYSFSHGSYDLVWLYRVEGRWEDGR
ncbi:MAG: hypothetical protein DRN57_08840 [Thermoplasmata archaeon]|nr:MAG: hypothetical protein DRN57_08840 [Thermoplasmata archaeon]